MLKIVIIPRMQLRTSDGGKQLQIFARFISWFIGTLLKTGRITETSLNQLLVWIHETSFFLLTTMRERGSPSTFQAQRAVPVNAGWHNYSSWSVVYGVIVYRWVENGTSRHHPNGMTLTIYSMLAYDFDHTICSNKWLGTGQTFMEVISMQREGITFMNLETGSDDRNWNRACWVLPMLLTHLTVLVDWFIVLCNLEVSLN